MGSLYAGAKVRASVLNATVVRYVATDDNVNSIATGGATYTYKWDTAFSTHANVTVSGTGNTTFTLNKTGFWFIDWQVRYHFVVTPTTGDVAAWCELVSGPTSVSRKLTASPMYIHSLPGAGFVRSFSSGDQLRVKVQNNTDQTAWIDNTEGHTSHFGLCWLQGV